MHLSRRELVVVMIVLAFIPITEHAFAQTCVETNTCIDGVNATSTDAFTKVFSETFALTVGDLIYLVVWGVIVGIIYMRSEQPINAGIAGLIIAATFTTSSFASAHALVARPIELGLILFACAFAFMFFTLMRSKINNP